MMIRIECMLLDQTTIWVSRLDYYTMHNLVVSLTNVETTRSEI